MNTIKPCVQVELTPHEPHFYKEAPWDLAEYECPGWSPDEGESINDAMDDEASYKWPEGDDKADVNAAMPRQFLRHRLSYNNLLVPVYATVHRTGVGRDHWGADNYTVQVFESGLIEVRDFTTGIPVRFYAPGSWLRVSYEWFERGTYHEANKLEWVDEDADQS